MNALTRNLIRQAMAKPGAERTQCDRILIVLASGEWVHSVELQRYSRSLNHTARIAELRRRGVAIDNRPNPKRPKGTSWHQYRLAEESDNA